jgi:hypothetical protein
MSMTGEDVDGIWNSADVHAEWNVFKYVIFEENMAGKCLEDGYEELLKGDIMARVKYLACVFLALCLSAVWCERGFSLMAAIKTKSRNRMSTSTLDDQMMIQSNGPACTEDNKSRIDKVLNEAVDHWSLCCTRMPSRSHPGVSRHRRESEAQPDVHNVLQAVDKQPAASALAVYRPLDAEWILGIR